MPSILSAELQVMRAANQSDLTTNGGRMSATVLSSGSVGACFPNAGAAERTAGSTKHRKVFFKVNHDGTETLLDARLWMDKYTEGDDKVTWFLGTQTDTQADITGNERKYGCGDLDATVIAGATSVTVAVELGLAGLFVNGDTVRISDKATPTSGTGNEEFVTISNVSQVGDIVSFDITPALANGYSDANTRVAAVYAVGDLKPTTASFTVTSAAGTYDNATYPLTLNDKSTIEQTWTLTFTSATAYNISGNTVGASGSGTVAGGAAPNNADFSLPYFTLAAAGFGGTYVAGDTISFITHPACVPIWLKRVIPAGAAAVASSTARLAMDGGTL